jgi:hypothetical protein
MEQWNPGCCSMERTTKGMEAAHIQHTDKESKEQIPQPHIPWCRSASQAHSRGTEECRPMWLRKGLSSSTGIGSVHLYTGSQRACAKGFRLMVMKKNMTKGTTENLELCINMFISPYVHEYPCCACLAEIKCTKTSCLLLCIKIKN